MSIIFDYLLESAIYILFSIGIIVASILGKPKTVEQLESKRHKRIEKLKVKEKRIIEKMRLKMEIVYKKLRFLQNNEKDNEKKDNNEKDSKIAEDN